MLQSGALRPLSVNRALFGAIDRLNTLWSNFTWNSKPPRRAEMFVATSLICSDPSPLFTQFVPSHRNRFAWLGSLFTVGPAGVAVAVGVFVAVAVGSGV